ncbi:MAG: C39 family peptidase [Candidatus Bathyarchaeia archaeon]
MPRETYAQPPVSPQIQFPPAASIQLSVPFCDQDKSVNSHYNLAGICWDTSAEMILNYWHNQGYLASVPSQTEIYSDTMSNSSDGNLNNALASLGFYSAGFYPMQTFYASYSNYQQTNNANNASQMIYTAQVALSLGVPLEASVETQPYPQANSSTGGILCDSRGQDHAIVITGYNQTGFIFNSATNEQSNPQFVSDNSLNTYVQDGRVVNGYRLYCQYSEFINAFSNESWSFTAIFPLNYAPVMRQQIVHLVDENNQPISGMLVSSPLSTARTDSDGYATLTMTYLGTPITLGYNMQTNAYDNFCGHYYDTRQVGHCSSGDYGIYMLYPTTANWQATTNRKIQYT